MQNNIESKKSNIVLIIVIPLLLLLRIYFDYKNFKDGNAYLRNQINHQITLNFEGKYIQLIDKNITLDILFHSYKYCGSKEIIRELGDKIAPNDVRTKLFVTKERNSNIFQTVINDTCYQFTIEPQSGFYGDIFGDK